MLRWAVVGTLAALALFLIGLWIGARYMHVESSEGDGLLGIEGRKTFDNGHTAQFLVSRDEDRYQAGAFESQCNG